DRMGKKPLFYFQQGSRFAFASEMKALLALQDASRDIDLAGLNLYLTEGYIPAPWTIFKQIRKINEASYLVFENGLIREHSYWTLPEPVENGTHQEKTYLDELEAILDDAVRCRLISDVPLGAFLSGGIDSSAVVAMMSRCSEPPAKTFTIDFAEQGFSERQDADLVAKHCKTQHEVMPVTTDAIGILPKLVWHFDEPFADSSAIPTYYVSQMARQRVTVILSGDGGDELFAGYNKYLKKDNYNLILRLPASLRKLIFKSAADALPIHAPMRNAMRYVAQASKQDGPDALGIYPYIKDDVLADDWRKSLSDFDATGPREQILAEITSMNKLARLQYLDTKLYLPADILVKVDRMSMANSLETRAPLLDYRLVEFAARLPVKFKLRDGTTKYLLRRLLRKYLPEQAMEKKKQGFAVPIRDWLATSLNGYAKEILLDRRTATRGILKQKTVEKVLQLHTLKQRDYSTWIWTLLNLELWYRTFVDNDTRRI
ncbi:MAG: asparagine synthase (glutamine-hydrolyzing), partial [Anaerolineae bacterium]|nr:asparagine synthase (glutamine-hydrolyzing) [Anaerolineae bacterium]